MDFQIIIQLGILIVLIGILINVAKLAGAVGVKKHKNFKKKAAKFTPPTAMRDMATPANEGETGAEAADMSGGGDAPIGRPKNYVSVEVINPDEAV